ncbi:carbohydrate ABC transporter permease [Pedococcus sp. 5OH_020]|uniref:carbohydrate ABC transporter permease n=1 Tax=Pedococcus sp. 5OH_020 TaxID=2989814 RepID=UPI0022E9DB71|nr:carbohydrate ABC transporter permease [Pedococcus sp. 5OH_020]
MTTSTAPMRVEAQAPAVPRRSGMRWRPIYLLILAWIVGVLGPYIWMAITSVTPLSELHATQTTIIPSNPSFRAYGRLITQTGFLRNIANSAIVAVTVVVIVVFCSLLAGTALSRYRFRGRRAVLYAILLLQLFPSILLLVPLYIELKNLHLLDNLVGLILVYSAFSMSFSTWLMKGFVDQIPGEIEEAALIDGCSKFQSFVYIMLPLSKPGIAAAGTYAFIYSWNEFIFALTFTSSNTAKTVPVGLSQFIGENIIRWDFLTSGGVIAAIPILIGFMFAQRGLIAGLASGAVKG